MSEQSDSAPDTHHELGNRDQARGWLAKAALAMDTALEDAMIDRYLRREVEAEMK